MPERQQASPDEPLNLPRGFRWGAATAGIKASGRPDLALAIADSLASAAAMFTSNLLAAAPVLVGHEHLAHSAGRTRAVLINSGNANCATGDAGIEAARRCCAELAALLGCHRAEVLPSSTGIIGVPLPADKIVAVLPAAVERTGSTAEHALSFAKAILTTDTRRKTSSRAVDLENGATVNLFGCCKGAGMIAPQLAAPHATMLAYLFTDLAIAPTDLAALLTPAVDGSFNQVSVDGDTSTNDTVLLVASGAAPVRWESLPAADRERFREALEQVCGELAYSIVDDGEGVTHVVTLLVDGAASAGDARQIARTVAHSPLCKTAWSSADPNWGRILAAAGRAGVPFDPGKATLTIAGLPVFRHGTRAAEFDEAAVHALMQERHYTIQLSLGVGDGACSFVTCDLTEEYVRINADYST